MSELVTVRPIETTTVEDRGEVVVVSQVQAETVSVGLPAQSGGSEGLPAHEAAADPHTGYQKESEKDQANGYAGLGANGLVPAARLGAGSPSGTTFLAGDQTWQAVSTPSAVDWKESVRVATTANITLSGTQTIDGVAVAVGNRVLVKDQATASQNGIYTVAAGAWARSTDADTNAEVSSGLATFVSEGTLNGNRAYVLVTDDPITLGSTALQFSQMSGSGGGDIAAHEAASNPHPGYATDADLAAHEAAADPHAGYVQESLFDAKGDLLAASAADTPARLPVGANDAVLMADSGQAAGLKWVGSQAASTQAFGDAAAEGTADTYSRGDHKHAMPANPVTAHEAAADPHAGYQKESERDAANGYLGLDSNARAPAARLGSGTPSASTFLAGDQSYKAPPAQALGALSDTNILTPVDGHDLQFVGGFWVNRLRRSTIRTISTTQAILDTDEDVMVDTGPGAVTATLPSPVGREGKTFRLKKISSSTNALTISGSIDGGSSVVVSNVNAAKTLVSDGAAWRVVAEVAGTPPVPIVSGSGYQFNTAQNSIWAAM